MIKEKTKDRSKLAYLKYSEIQANIDNDTLDEFDIIFAKDTKQGVFIDGNKQIQPFRGRLDVYENETSATIAINTVSYTYEGQLVIIKTEEDGYKPYVVNKNTETNQYYIEPVNSGHSQIIVDYNHAENKPIINLIGDMEIDISNLANGYYRIIGNYIISPNDTTHRMTSKYILFAVDHDVDEKGELVTYVSEITGNIIKRYIATTTSVIEDTYVLSSEMSAAIDQELDEKIDGYMDGYVANNGATTQDIQDLFHN